MDFVELRSQPNLWLRQVLERPGSDYKIGERLPAETPWRGEAI